jgi:hypothetical protein
MQIGMYSFDCRDAAALADFWAKVLVRRVDASAMIELFTAKAPAKDLRRRVILGDLVAPELFDLEIAQVLRKLVLGRPSLPATRRMSRWPNSSTCR